METDCGRDGREKTGERGGERCKDTGRNRRRESATWGRWKKENWRVKRRGARKGGEARGVSQLVYVAAGRVGVSGGERGAGGPTKSRVI